MVDKQTEREAEQARRKEGTAQMTVHQAGMITKDLIERGEEAEREKQPQKR